MQSRTTSEKPYGFWNWGTGIAIAIIIAASAMIFLVYKSMQVNFEMAEKDYYSAELKFDGKMKAAENAAALSSDIIARQNGEQLIIQFPAECFGQQLQGTAVLYRPSAENKDVMLPLVLNQDGQLLVSKQNLLKGLYRLKVNWEMNGIAYNSEQNIYVIR